MYATVSSWSSLSMRKLCPNLDRDDRLDTVLEVPIPEEMFTSMGSNAVLRWQNLCALMKAKSLSSSSGSYASSSSSSESPLQHLSSGSRNEFMALLKLVESPLIPFQQYLATTGGQGALNAIYSMYAVGQVKMAVFEMRQGNGCVYAIGSSKVGEFVLWQKNPDQWYLELVVARLKVSTGSDGKGLDARSTANLFLDAYAELAHHKVWGYFSQRTGLLVHFEDTKLERMKSIRGNNSVFWETTMESTIEDYKYVDGINIAHGGKTSVTMFRYGAAQNHKRKIEETWRIEELVDGATLDAPASCGLSMDCFLPTADVKREQEGGDQGMS
ncbi:hypothetical protein ACJRO7_023977 [Eucalyptus globulus]|uniref:DUF620 family protein n=1 Tax=Eucalyptus globulus TaxID=34317 RepID=A0ABD3K3Z1_EUCGL